MDDLTDIDLTQDEIRLLVAALDSHEYWQLSQEHERDSGASTVADGEDPDIDACRALMGKLDDLIRRPCGACQHHHNAAEGCTDDTQPGRDDR